MNFDGVSIQRVTPWSNGLRRKHQFCTSPYICSSKHKHLLLSQHIVWRRHPQIMQHALTPILHAVMTHYAHMQVVLCSHSFFKFTSACWSLHHQGVQTFGSWVVSNKHRSKEKFITQFVIYIMDHGQQNSNSQSKRILCAFEPCTTGPQANSIRLSKLWNDTA